MAAKGHTFTFRVAKKGLFFKIKAAAVGLYNLHLAKIPLFSVNEHIRKKMYGSWALSNVLKRARKKRLCKIVGCPCALIKIT